MDKHNIKSKINQEITGGKNTLIIIIIIIIINYGNNGLEFVFRQKGVFSSPIQPNRH
jgi:hypothetical protein